MKINTKKGILLITPFFSPNIGGVETHLNDLVRELDKQNYSVYVHTYSPLTTANVNWKPHEKIGHIDIYRYKWIGKNIFHKVEKIPFFDFLYLTPYLFIRTYFWMLKNHTKISTIHSHGFNGAVIGLLIQKIFRIKHINSTHTLYENKPSSTTAFLTKSILNQIDIVLAQSNASAKQLISWNVNSKIIYPYRYWLDLTIFKKKNKTRLKIRTQLKLKPSDFIVLSVGRLIRKKGVCLLAKIATKLPNIYFIFIGTGPEENFLSNFSKTHKNIIFLGKIPNSQLPDFYNAADIFCSPVLYQEGFSRTIMESIACGTPVLASNYGTIPEITSTSNAILIKPTLITLIKNLRNLSIDTSTLKNLKKNCRGHALKYYNSDNIQMITKHYV